jgi:hypothetical protein
VKSVRTCLTIALLISTPVWAAKKPKGHHTAGGAQQSEVHLRSQAACGLAAHETDGTTTCLDRPPDTAKDDMGGEAVGAIRDRDAPTGMPGLPSGPGSY